MADHITYEESKKKVFKGLYLLGAITIFEVFFALLTTGHIVDSINFRGTPLHYLYILVMIGLSLYKAYFIIYEFMHMGYEVPGLRVSVLLPMALLIWAVIAFFQEGSVWGARRTTVQNFNKEVSANSIKVIASGKDSEVAPIEAPVETPIEHEDGAAHENHGTEHH